jgi:hypothetical protein
MEKCEILKFYADVHKTKKNSERCRITYTTDGTTFRHVDSFSGFRLGPETNYSWIRYRQATLMVR